MTGEAEARQVPCQLYRPPQAGTSGSVSSRQWKYGRLIRLSFLETTECIYFEPRDRKKRRMVET